MISSKYEMERDELLCVFAGRLDAEAGQADTKVFESAWQAAQNERGDRAGAMKIVFDLGEVNYVSSGFLRLCMQASKKPGGNQLHVVNTSPDIKKLFTMAGLDLFVY
ncbi:MAG: STAS domain-containing protein [Kiritimatiellae bacterium]|nr:STAS domain-containing protein [Kiritimatiellia bacterium]